MDSSEELNKTLKSSMESLSISEPPTLNQVSTLNHLCFEFESLQDLAYQGSWRSILEKIVHARKLSLLQKPHEHLVYLTYNVLALTKLRRFGDAVDELETLDDLDSAKYKYETYPDHYPGQSGSMVPFGLRWLHAQMPHRLGRKHETLDRLYVLLDLVRNKLKERGSLASTIPSETQEEKPGVDSDLDDFGDFVSGNADTKKNCIDQWRKREMILINSILSHHLSQKEFDVCMMLIKDLLDRSPGDPILLSKLGYVQMQLGDLDGARDTFTYVESLMKGESGDGFLGLIEFKNLVNRNRALQYLVAKDYTSAIREYEECIERNPTDIVAISNKALCLMYSRDLSDSIKVLENALESIPTAALNETVIVNLCSMYELAYVNHSDIKRTLSNWIARVAPDDFDSSCTRI